MARKQELEEQASKILKKIEEGIEEEKKAKTRERIKCLIENLTLISMWGSFAVLLAGIIIKKDILFLGGLGSFMLLLSYYIFTTDIKD